MNSKALKPFDILLVEDSLTDVLLAKEALACSKIGNNLHTVPDGVEAMAFLRRVGKYQDAPRPSLILLDLNLPKKDGREVLGEIKSDEKLKGIPVVVLTTSKSESDIQMAHGLHANCYIVKPVDFEKFAKVVNSIVNFWFAVVTLPGNTDMNTSPITSILHVEDSPTDALLTRAELEQCPDFQLTQVERLDEALRVLATGNYAAVLLDLGLPDSQGLDTLLRFHREAPQVPVVVVTARDDEELALRAVQAGAQDYLVKGHAREYLLDRTIRYAIERKMREEAVRKSERRLREVTEHIDQALWKIDAKESRILYISGGYEKMWGRSCQSLIDNPNGFMEGIHPLDQEMMRREFAAMYQTGRLDAECRILRPDGSVRWVWIRGYPVTEQGKIVRLVGVIEDITEKRHLTAERDSLLSRLQLHIQRIPLAYVLFDADFLIIDWNPAAERIFGYTKEEVLGKGPPHEQLIPRSFWQKAEELLHRIHSGDMQAHSTNENLTKDGRKITCEWYNTPLMDENGQFAGLLCLGQDVTERKSLEAQFHQAQKMEAIGQLAGGVAHDFNNLLTIISGYSEILLSKLGPSDPMRESVRAISEAGTRAASLTRQLLAFSRKTVLEPKVLDLNEVVRDTEKLLRRLIGEDILLTAVLDPTINRVKVDPGQLGQILMNLAVNARDAMPRGGKLTVETRNVELDQEYAHLHPEVKPGRYVKLTITDTGTGMTPEVKGRIFEPFFTTKGVGKGTGLGLAVVLGIVKQSGGNVEVYSEPDIGTTFKIYFPAVEEKVSAPKGIDIGIVGRGTETVLLVEDEDSVRGLAILVLQSYGYKVLPAASGKEALRLVENQRGIDLLVTDVVMPGMGGPDLAETLRPRFPQMKVLFCSGYTNDAVVRHGLLQEKVAFLHKPYTPLLLARKVRQVLDVK